MFAIWTKFGSLDPKSIVDLNEGGIAVFFCPYLDRSGGISRYGFTTSKLVVGPKENTNPIRQIPHRVDKNPLDRSWDRPLWVNMEHGMRHERHGHLILPSYIETKGERERRHRVMSHCGAQ